MASDPLNDNGGSGSVAWHFMVNSADIAFLAPGQTLTQDYAVTVADNFGGTAVQNVSIAIHGVSPQNLTVNPGATLDIASAFGGSVTFASSTCTLQLDTSTAFTGRVSGLSSLDTLDLRDITAGASAAVNFSGTASGGTPTWHPHCQHQLTGRLYFIDLRRLGRWSRGHFGCRSPWQSFHPQRRTIGQPHVSGPRQRSLQSPIQ